MPKKKGNGGANLNLRYRIISIEETLTRVLDEDPETKNRTKIITQDAKTQKSKRTLVLARRLTVALRLHRIKQSNWNNFRKSSAFIHGILRMNAL